MQEEKFLIQEEIFLVQYGRFLPGLVRPAVRASKPLVRSSVRLCDNPESLCGRPDVLCARPATCARVRGLVRKFGMEIQANRAPCGCSRRGATRPVVAPDYGNGRLSALLLLP